MAFLARRTIALWGLVLSGTVAVGATAGMSLPEHATATVAHGMSAARMAQMSQMAPAAKTLPKAVLLLHRRVVQLTIHNFAFAPANVVVSPGTKLIWTNKDSDPHTVDSVKSVWTSDALDTGDHFTRVFAKAGTYAYYCSVHPFMHGTVTVQK